MAEITGLAACQPPGPHRPEGPLRPADPKLWKAAKEFEAVFLGQFVKAMRTSSLQGELLEESAGRETFDAMFSEEVARQMAEAGSLGLQKAIYRDMGGEFRASQLAETQAGPDQGAESPASAAGRPAANDYRPENNDEP
jgi:Rod binding domain-containing protein